MQETHFTKVGAREERGFSLVEVVIAIGIFGFAALAVLGSLTSLFAVSKSSCDDTTAGHIARQIFTDLQPPSGGHDGILFREEDTTPVDIREANSLTAFYTANGQPSRKSDSSTIYEAQVTLTPFPDAKDPGRTGLSDVKIRITQVGSSINSPAYEFLTRIAAKTVPRT